MRKFKSIISVDTAGSAKDLADGKDNSIAAIASDLSAKMYNLKILEKKEIRWIPVEEFKNKEKLAILRPHYVEIIKQVVKRQRFIINHIEQL